MTRVLLEPHCSILGCDEEAHDGVAFCNRHQLDLLRAIERLGFPKRVRILSRWKKLELEIIEP